MAITAVEYSLFRSLRRQGLLPLGGDVLEIGEANWYGDVGVLDLQKDIQEFAPEERRGALEVRLGELIKRTPAPLFDIAKVVWETFLHPASLTAIDFHGTADALRLDLNKPIDLQRQFDVVMNLGTVEHVFNVAQAMQTIHDHTRPGGLMIHGMPLSGWVEHGFYAFNSTFYFDVARANGYEVVLALYAELDTLKMLRLADRGRSFGCPKAMGSGRTACSTSPSGA
jgi:SAM-dependent methyltransferase